MIHRRASFGTTKYCNFFLRGIQCTNSECMYLHYMAKEEDCFTKKEMQERQSEFYNRTHPNMAARSTPLVLKSLDSLPLPPEEPGSRQSQRLIVESELEKGKASELSSSEEASPIQYCKIPAMEVMDVPFACSRVVDETQADDYSNLMGLFTASLPTFPTCKSSLKIDVNFLLQADSFVHSARSKAPVSRGR